MPLTKLPKTVNEVLSFIRKSGRFGVQQKDVEVATGISKSYCSEIISQLEELGTVRKVPGHGHTFKLYATEFFPGRMEGILRVGLLKSSEYIPFIAVFLDVCNSRGLRPVLRFYNGTFDLLNDLRYHSIDFCLAPTSSLVQSAVLGGDIKILSGLASGGSGVVEKIDSENREILSTEASSMVSMALWSGATDDLEGIQAYENPNEGMRRFKEGSCGKIAIWEPYFSQLLSDVSNRCLVNYEEVLDGFPCCSVATSLSFYTQDRELSNTITSQYTSINLDSLKTSLSFSKALGSLARVTKHTKKFIEKSLDSYDFKSVNISRNALSRFGISLSLRQEKEIFLSDRVSK